MLPIMQHSTSPYPLGQLGLQFVLDAFAEARNEVTTSRR